jgi:hypothetical protein
MFIYPLLPAVTVVVILLTRHLIGLRGYTGHHRLPRKADGGADAAWAATLHVWALQGERDGLLSRSRG